MKNLKQYLATGALALTAGCMTPTQINSNRNFELNGIEYSGITKIQDQAYLVKTDESNVRYSAEVSGRVKRDSDKTNTYTSFESAKDAQGREIGSLILQVDSTKLKELSEGKTSLDKILGETQTIPGIGKVIPYEINGKTIYLSLDKNTRFNWNETGKAQLHGAYFQKGNSLNSTQIEQLRNPPREQKVEEPKEQKEVELFVPPTVLSSEVKQ